jgi:hypothetical protein
MIVLYYQIAPDGRLANIIESESDVPVSEGDVLLGPDETMKEPPDLIEGMTPVFKDGAWIQEKSAFFAFPWEMIRPEWNGTKWVETLTVEEMKALKLEELAGCRWEQETGGLTLPNGAEIKTDRESQALLTGASLYALQNPAATVEWKGANGWVTLTAAQIQEIAMLVRNHVQEAFSREKELAAKVEACETVEEVDAVTW